MRSNFTGMGSYNSEYRGFSRGLGRGHLKPFQSSQRPPFTQPSRKGDIFLEAGRLAVEYLVSNGLLSINMISRKCQNGTLRNSSGEFQDHRGSQDREIVPNSRVDGRSVGATRQETVSPDEVSGTRRVSKDEDHRMSRNHSGERRRFGASRSYSSDWSRENGRERSFSKGMDDENDKFLRGKSKDAYIDVHDFTLKEFSSKDDRHGEMQGEMEKSHHVDIVPNTTSLQNTDEVELPIPSDLEANRYERTKDGNNNREGGKEIPKNELADQHCEAKSDNSSKDGVDLLKLCASAKIPTKVCSSLINKSAKWDSNLISEDKDDNKQDSIAPMKDDTLDTSSVTESSDEMHSSSMAGMTLSDLPLTEKTVSSKQKSDGLPELGRCRSAADDRGEKRVCEDENKGKGAKKVKQWLSVSQFENYSELSDSSEKGSTSPSKSLAPASILNEGNNQESFGIISLPLKSGGELAKEQGEEKQMFSNSFKICDLNLMEASDMPENRYKSVPVYPSISAPCKSPRVGIDLSMNNNCSLTNSYNDCGTASKENEIIDLDSGNLAEGERMNTSAQNLEADITNVGSYQNSSHNNHSLDAHDGYGFMIPEFLGNDVANSSSVQPDINEMGIHHGPAIIAEDDPIYMSLGDIPLSPLRDWDQQPQERSPFEM